MANESTTSIGVSHEADLLSEVWAAPPSISADGLPLHQLLTLSKILVSLTERRSPADDDCAEPAEANPCCEILQQTIRVVRAERAFVFELSPPAAGASGPRVGDAIASSDLDGEPVSRPERKVPLEVLEDVAACARPVVGSPSADGNAPDAGGHGPDQSGEPRYLAFPVRCRGELQAVLYLENRFQPLEVNRTTLRLACAHGYVLGIALAWRRVRVENLSLWTDVKRLREARPGEAAPAKVPATARRAASRHPKRANLRGDYSAIVGSSPRMLEILQVVDRISSSNAPVLINGESGTGKELVARAVHANSPRRDKIFVSENCGALTETLLESELFGYVKGAFTGATKDHKGLFELAEGGTLFLDEVGDMSPGMQKKLLRVLQEKVIRPVGGKDYITTDVRIISATNKDLKGEVRSGNFREDLYYRLNVINLVLPPLRDRKEDIPDLVASILAELNKEYGTSKKITPAAVERLANHNWPGNVRELRNELKRLLALADGDIDVQDLSEGVLAGETQESSVHALGPELFHLTLKDATERLEKAMIRNAIIQNRGNKSLVAKTLKVPKTSLYNKINKYGLDKL